MFRSIKNGVVITSVLDMRTVNKEGTYPIKIKVYYQRKPKYYSVGISMSKEEFDKLPESGSAEGRYIQGEIEKEFSRIQSLSNNLLLLLMVGSDFMKFCFIQNNYFIAL